MRTTLEHARILAVPLSGIAMVLAGLAAAPAQAATSPHTTIVHIENAKGVAIKGLTVEAAVEAFTAYSDTDGPYVPETFRKMKTAGDYKATGLSPGGWTLHVYDNRKVSQPYADGGEAFTVDEHGNSQVLPRITMAVGAVVRGKVTAPSGHSLKNVWVFASSAAPDPSNSGNGDVSDSKGAFRVLGLKADSYDIIYSFPDADDAEYTVDKKATELTAGQISTGLKITTVRVPFNLWTATVKGKSTKKKTATLTVKDIAKTFGLTNPGGTITVNEGETLQANAKVKKGASTISLGGLTKGKHTFTVVYSGSEDVNKGSFKITVKVK